MYVIKLKLDICKCILFILNYMQNIDVKYKYGIIETYKSYLYELFNIIIFFM